MTTTISNETSTCVYVKRREKKATRIEKKNKKKKNLVYSDAEYNDNYIV